MKLIAGKYYVVIEGRFTGIVCRALEPNEPHAPVHEVFSDDFPEHPVYSFRGTEHRLRPATPEEIARHLTS